MTSPEEALERLKRAIDGLARVLDEEEAKHGPANG